MRAGAKLPELDEAELDQRVKILHRFRELLQAQRDRFQQYLELLEKQKDLIEGDWTASSGEGLETQVNLEERIVTDIFAIQKVMEPLEAMYRAAYPAPKKRGRKPKIKKEEESAGIPDLKTALEGLRAEAQTLAERNREILARRMGEVKTEIKTLSGNAYRKGRSVYGEAPPPSLIDIKG
ncbi:MAG: flagellar export chaperone FlgN [Spirochaetaceae bacterium]|nr:flagellar export chaperone FlgN [Spirochaetaceae bacterium]